MLHELIDNASYMAHGYCLLWKPWLVSLHAGSDLIVAVSYFAIPVAIWIFLKQRPDLEMKGLAAMFAAFILLCGITHIFGLVTLWLPIYEAQGYAKGMTAIVSAATAFLIFPLIPKALAIPSPKDLAGTNLRLTEEIEAHKKTLSDLEAARLELQRALAAETLNLQESEMRFQATQESSPDGFMMFNAVRDEAGAIVDFNWVFSNAAGAAIVGRDENRLPGKTLLGELPGHRESGLFDAYARVVETGEHWQNEFEYSHDDVHGWFRATAVKAGDGFAVSFADITERKKREEQLTLLMREVNHRSKNLLAVVEAIVRLTARSADPATLVESLQGRLHGLSASHDLIVESEWTSVDVADLVRSQLRHLGETLDESIFLDGAPMRVKSQAAQGIGLAIHELATNAMKYGALSKPGGAIHIDWTVSGEGDDREFRISWSESGGPHVADPTHKGFGHTVIERMAAQSVSGRVDLKFEDAGLQWALLAPAGNVVDFG